jgi:hypothetical protein
LLAIILNISGCVISSESDSVVKLIINNVLSGDANTAPCVFKLTSPTENDIIEPLFVLKTLFAK